MYCIDKQKKGGGKREREEKKREREIVYEEGAKDKSAEFA